MKMQILIQSLQDIFEDNTKHIVERKPILVQPKHHEPFIDGKMSKEPKSVILWVANNDQISHYEVHALSVP